MEISEEAYRGFSWNPNSIILDEIQTVFSSKAFESANQEANSGGMMVTMITSQKVSKFSDKRLKIEGRYDSQRFIHKGKVLMNSRADWTPTQKRRIRKQTYKWRKRIMEEI